MGHSRPVADTDLPTPDPGAGRVDQLGCAWYAAIVALSLTTAVAANSQDLPLRHPRELLAAEPEAFVALLEAARPPAVSAEDMSKILRALPPTGEVRELESSPRGKLEAVRELLTAARRDWYEVKIIDVPQAAIALHARAVLLISGPAVALLNGAELQALAAHEIGHEYTWTEWNRARLRADQDRLKALELVSDAIAIVTLRRLGMEPSRLIEAVDKVSRFNRKRFETRHETNYPTIAERRAFARRVDRWCSPIRPAASRAPADVIRGVR